MSKKFEINIKDDEEKRKLNSGTLSNQIIQICKRCHGLIPVINLNYDPSCSLWFWFCSSGLLFMVTSLTFITFTKQNTSGTFTQ